MMNEQIKRIIQQSTDTVEIVNPVTGITHHREFFDRTQLNQILFALIGSSELVEQWWGSPNKAFDDENPSKVLATDPEKVVTYILSQLNSDYS
jgi:hypothetical protein